MNAGERRKWVRLYDARVYREMIGGERGTDVDREIIHALEEAAQVDSRPWVENRGFLVRAVTYLARDAGIDQFLNIGAGLPAWGDVHEVARRYRPGAAVAQVDHDPEVVETWREVAAGQGPMCSVWGDVCRPERILAEPEVRAVLDFDRPVALLLTALFNLIDSVEYDHFAIVRTLVGALPPGSHLVLSQISDEGHPREPFEAVRRVVQAIGAGFTTRSREEIARFFEGLVLVEPGLVRVAHWRPVHTVSRESGWFVGGVGRKPEPELGVKPGFFDARLYREALGAGRGGGEETAQLRFLEGATPTGSQSWVENRSFMVRAVTYLAREAGIDQFLDVGPGLPAWGSVHEIARRYRPGAAVAYVDADPEVVDAWREVAAGQGPMCSVQGDLRRPERIALDPEVRAVLDFDRPVGLVLTAVLNLIGDAVDHVAIVRTLVDALPAGSFLVLSQLSDEGHPAEVFTDTHRLMAVLGERLVIRSRAEIVELFEGLEPVEPGLVRVPYWRPVHTKNRPVGWFFGGVARKP